MSIKGRTWFYLAFRYILKLQKLWKFLVILKKNWRFSHTRSCFNFWKLIKLIYTKLDHILELKKCLGMLNFRSLIWGFKIGIFNYKSLCMRCFFYIRISNFYFFVAERQTPAKPWPKTDKICSIDTLNSFTMVPDLEPAAAAVVAEVATAQVNFIWYLF